MGVLFDFVKTNESYYDQATRDVIPNGFLELYISIEYHPLSIEHVREIQEKILFLTYNTPVDFVVNEIFNFINNNYEEIISTAGDVYNFDVFLQNNYPLVAAVFYNKIYLTKSVSIDTLRLMSGFCDRINKLTFGDYNERKEAIESYLKDISPYKRYTEDFRQKIRMKGQTYYIMHLFFDYGNLKHILQSQEITPESQALPGQVLHPKIALPKEKQLFHKYKTNPKQGEISQNSGHCSDGFIPVRQRPFHEFGSKRYPGIMPNFVNRDDKPLLSSVTPATRTQITPLRDAASRQIHQLLLPCFPVRSYPGKRVEINSLPDWRTDVTPGQTEDSSSTQQVESSIVARCRRPSIDDW